MFAGYIDRIRKKFAYSYNKIIPLSSTDYGAIAARDAVEIKDVRGKHVLVVGCNTGRECTYFVHAGARLVYGVDITDDIGSEYVHERISYHKNSVEKLPFPENTFDLVYAFATLEHVNNIDLAFSEMHRVCKKKGIIFSIASPLWNSQYGHHKSDLFSGYPWIHLILDKNEIIQWFIENKATSLPGYAENIEHHVSYMLNDNFFNKKFAKEYIKACASLDATIIKNEIDCESPSVITQEAKNKLFAYDEFELLGVTHRYIGKKN